MRIHMIAIGGAVMHNLALALRRKGFTVTGSDDEIFDPARSRLEAASLLPAAFGWDPGRIHSGLDAVILGMHARSDNPELGEARKLGLRIYSFPEYMYEHSRDKRRIVIGGSHGKTTITGLVLHALRVCGARFDYLVGAELEGFDTMVGLGDETGVAVFEGDEYLSSALDRRPKFLLYRPHIALVSGIAWDHVNVFPAFEGYVDQFRQFLGAIEPDGCLVFNREDPRASALAGEVRKDVEVVGYGTPRYRVSEGRFELIAADRPVPVNLLGKHNMQNIAAARAICRRLGIADGDFYAATGDYRGAARRLALLAESGSSRIYLDFAHSPSKVAATTMALKEAFPDRRLVVCLELHTFSSLNASFLPEYRGSLEPADHALVYFAPHTLESKKLPALDAERIRSAFGRDDLVVFEAGNVLESHLRSLEWGATNLLLMSSGNFSGMDLRGLADELLGLGPPPRA